MIWLISRYGIRWLRYSLEIIKHMNSFYLSEGAPFVTVVIYMFSVNFYTIKKLVYNESTKFIASYVIDCYFNETSNHTELGQWLAWLAWHHAPAFVTDDITFLARVRSHVTTCIYIYIYVYIYIFTHTYTPYKTIIFGIRYLICWPLPNCLNHQDTLCYFMYF